MGAGSAKGLRKSASADEVDNLSISSDGRWVDNDGNNEGVTGTSIKPLEENKRSKSFDFPSSNPKQNQLKVSDGGDNTDGGKEPPIKRGGRKIWNFFSDKDANGVDSSVTSDIIGESEPPNNSSNNKENTKRFKLFGRKKEVKDEKLDNEINDLEKTFDSLGIVGKSVWEGGQDIKPKHKSKDDLATLEPMRNRLNVRIARPPRGINGLTAVNERRLDTSASDPNSNSSSKKKFNFSWDNDEDSQSLEIDEWDYRAIKIDGFDPNKFKKANFEDQVTMNHPSVPQKIRSPHSPPPISRNSPSPPLQYDADDHQILASIEKALME